MLNRGALYFIILFLTNAVRADVLVSRTVGQVGDRIVTSRQVHISHFLNEVLVGKSIKNLTDENSDEFESEVSEMLLEIVVEKEAASFSLAQVSQDSLDETWNSIKGDCSKSALWNQLEVSDFEAKEYLFSKLRAKKFLKFKSDSTSIAISDSEVREYYDRNRLKFSNLPLSDFKENIRAFLKKQRQEESIKQWFELLKTKYRIRKIERLMS